MPLLFPLDLRKLDFDLSNDVANYCNEIPLMATFTPDRVNTARVSLEKFVLANDHSIMRDIRHGVLPFSMFDSLADSARCIFGSCVHGIGIEMTSAPEVNGHVGLGVGEDSGGKLKAKRTLKLPTSAGTAYLPLDLETNLMIDHHLPSGLCLLTLSYKRSVLDRHQADAILRALVFVVTRLLTRPHTSLRKMVRQSYKLKRRLAKRGRNVSAAHTPSVLSC